MNDKLKFPSEGDQQIDDLFRSALGNHTVEPSPTLWKGINRKLLWKEISRFKFTNLPAKYWLAGGAVVAVIIGLLIWNPINRGARLTVTESILQKSSNNTGNQSNHVVLKEKESSTTNKENLAGVAVAQSSPPTQSGLHSGKMSSRGDALHRTISSKRGVVLASATTSSSGGKQLTEPFHPSEGESFFLPPSSSADRWTLPLLKPLDTEGLYLNYTDTVISFNTPQGIMRVNKEKPMNLQSFSADFGVTPEWISYNTTHSYAEMNYWLNAGFSYHISRFSVKTGVSLGYVYDEGKYSVKYLSKDSIGYFTSVISFYVNPENQNELIFNTKNVAVYDSLQHFADDRTRDRYTYLEVPLLFGYQLFETNNLSLDLTCGPAFSLLIGTRKAQPYIDYPNARIIRIDDNTPDRVKMNWKIALGLHLEYRVNKNLGCYLEPTYKYYFNSFIDKEQTSSRKPYSIGIGLGIRYHFGQIKK
jgi:hypothetical protein